MGTLEEDIQAILRDLSAAQRPDRAHFAPTALEQIWTGDICGTPVVLKRSEHALEGLVYRHLVPAHGLPAPALVAAREDPAGDGCWLVLEPVSCTPPGLSPRSPTHWWQNAERRDRALTLVAAFHGQFWNRPAALAEQTWLPRYTADHFWSALDLLSRPPEGFVPLSEPYLGQLASAAEMLIAGSATLIHGSLNIDNLGWRGASPVLLDWERTAWGTPYADLGRLFTRVEALDGRPVPFTERAWIPPLLELYRAGVAAVADVDLRPEALALDVRNGMLWELAVDLWRQTREPARGDARKYGLARLAAEELAAEP
ncbi:MAG: aminoglycoside phosphotransferase family protein [Armatimonadetes bacterium]|nr:aminoglycoside phosphotransferase family protein [Armatimonadota bacterium]